VFVARYGKAVLKIMFILACFSACACSAQGKTLEVEPEVFTFASTQAKGKNKRGRGTGRKPKGQKKKFHIPSGGTELSDDDYDEHESKFDFAQEYEEDVGWKYAPTGRKAKRDVEPQSIPEPRKETEPAIRNKIHRSRKPVSAKASDLKKWLEAAKSAYSVPCKPQSFNSDELAAGVYKFYRVDGDETTYLCTGTHIGNKMWVVLHSMSEDMSVCYRAVNHVHTFNFKGSSMSVYGEHLATFPVNGFSSPFRATKLKELVDASIVTVYGYGSGTANKPDSMVGFASPQGWCNAKTRGGDCTSPVLDCDGNIVGFWTHGNGVDFGRFEIVTPELIAFAKQGPVTIHSGLDFQLRPHSR
jgi:hypothetical protein